MSRGELSSDELWPFPHLDELCLEGVLVDRRGVLWPVHGDTAVALVTQLARSEDPRGFTVVVDQELWETTGCHDPFHMAAANPDVAARGGPLLEAPTLEELADRMAVPISAVRRGTATLEAPR